MNVFIVSTGTIFHGATRIIGVYSSKELAESSLKDKAWNKVEANVWQSGASYLKIEEFGIIDANANHDLSLFYDPEFREEQRRLLRLEDESELKK